MVLWLSLLLKTTINKIRLSLYPNWVEGFIMKKKIRGLMRPPPHMGELKGDEKNKQKGGESFYSHI